MVVRTKWNSKFLLHSKISCYFFFFKLLLKNSRHILDLFSEKPFLIRMEAMDATFHLS